MKPPKVIRGSLDRARLPKNHCYHICRISNEMKLGANRIWQIIEVDRSFLYETRMLAVKER